MQARLNVALLALLARQVLSIERLKPLHDKAREHLAAQLVDEYWHDNRRDIVGIVDGSFLEEYDEYNIGVQFKAAATVSITYALMSRCGLEPERYFDHEDFMAIFDFNTPSTIGALGTAVSQLGQQVLQPGFDVGHFQHILLLLQFQRQNLQRNEIYKTKPLNGV